MVDAWHALAHSIFLLTAHKQINIFCLFKQNMQQSIRSWLPSWIHLWTKVFTNSFIILCFLLE